MAKTRLSGIDGVLQGLLSSVPGSPGAFFHGSTTQSPVITQRSPNSEGSQKRGLPRHTTRCGRPVVQSGNPQQSKQKVTFRIRAALVDEYRDWSWEARCCLSELVERAMLQFRKRHRRCTAEQAVTDATSQHSQEQQTT